MNYWKLGCNWGRGMPDFYSLLKEQRIVICGDHPMAKDDWVLICQGHNAVALAKIGSVPVSSTAWADLQGDFERLQITYDVTNSVADVAEFYELTDSERFQYQLQQGIFRINNPDIRGAIERILTAREKTKMITQATKLPKSMRSRRFGLTCPCSMNTMSWARCERRMGRRSSIRRRRRQAIQTSCSKTTCGR